MTTPSHSVAPTDSLPISQMEVQHLRDLFGQMQQQVQQHEERFKEFEALYQKISSLEEKNFSLQALNEKLTTENEKLRQQAAHQATKPDTLTPTSPKGTSASTWASVAEAYTPAKPPVKKVRSPSPKKLMSKGRFFLSPEEKGPQGFKYIYLWRSGKTNRSDIRSRLRAIGVDTGRILDINFPATKVLGLLMHIQYVEQFTAVMQKAGVTPVKDFDPLDPAHLADPKFASLSVDEREHQMLRLVHDRAIATLSFLRPLGVPSVARSFLEWGWIDEEDVQLCVAASGTKRSTKTITFLSANPDSQGDAEFGSDFGSDMEL